MQKIILLGMLGIYAIEDFRRKTLSVQYLSIFALAGVILHLYLKDLSAMQMSFGILSGVAVLGLSLVTNESIGKGDGILLIVTGIFLGGVDNFELLCISVFYAAIFSLIMLLVGVYKRNQEIAFVPFLFL